MLLKIISPEKLYLLSMTCFAGISFIWEKF